MEEKLQQIRDALINAQATVQHYAGIKLDSIEQAIPAIDEIIAGSGCHHIASHVTDGVRIDAQNTDKQAALEAPDSFLHSRSDEITWEDVVDILAPHWRTFRAALTSPPVNAALLEALIELDQACISDFSFKYPGGTHEVVQKAIAAAEAQPAQKVVDVENNIKLLCHECGKTHEHEYNQPPRHGSCEVCGRQNMLCTRVMTEAARLQLERQKMGG